MRHWWLRLVHYARPHSSGLLLVVLLMLIGVGFDLLKPWPLSLIVDYVLTDRPLPSSVAWIASLPGGATPSGQTAWLAAGILLLFLFSQAAVAIQGYLQAGVGLRMAYDLGGHLFDYLQRLSLSFHGRRPTGDLVRRVTKDSACIRDLIMGVFLPVLTALVTLVTMFAIIWSLSRTLALLALLIVPLMALLIRAFNRPMTERTYVHQELEGEVMSLAEQALTAVPVVQAFNRENQEDGRFRDLSQRTVRAAVRAVVSQIQFRVGVNAATAFGTAAVMFVGGLQVLQGGLSLGALLVCLTYVASLYAPLAALALVSSGFAASAARARRVIEILDTQDEVRDLPGAKALSGRRAGSSGWVKVENVTFGYEHGRPVLHEVSVEAHPGETVALVGKTGAGKSTLASLIPRLFDPWQGRVTFEGLDVRTLKITSLREQIALVLQEPFLLPLTIAENIAYGRPGSSRREITEAARSANAEEFIDRLPQGYDTPLGERGVNLSGGQKQRIAIARALLKNAPVLILDEPTSALDPESEDLLLQGLERLKAGRTTFIIAHRLSTIRQADRIVVLDKGRVVENGTPEELLALEGLYHHFHSLQEGRPVQ
jgi:ATP-binding cassette, subfamily B, bacterial